MSLNVLLVDDSIVVRSMVKKSLMMVGLPMGEVYQACNGEEGLEVLRQESVDLVILDINMPVMNGEEMLKAMKADPQWEDIPVVVISTEGSQTRIDKLEAMGARFVHKPFPPEAVRNVIQTFPRICDELETAGSVETDDSGVF